MPPAPAPAVVPASAGRPAILLHAGAGPLSAELREHERESRDVLAEVLAIARSGLERGTDALSTVLAAVRAMESCELFNAGVGSALCSDGRVEMSAALMRGCDRAAGAVAGIRTLAHTVDGARAVLDSDQVLLIGESAERFAAERGVARLPESDFVTERARSRLARGAATDRGTVGAVCLDRHGVLAAATSTGGITGQPPGRVGDSPLIGAGTWADGRVAVSCTGDGEAFVRSGTAHRIACLVEQGVPVAEAGRAALDDVRQLGGAGGVIVLAADGTAALPFTAGAMPRGAWLAGAEPGVWIA